MDTRGQSATLGTVLVIAITVAAATATVGAAVFALDESRTQANEERASISAAQFDSAAALVAFGEEGATTTVGIGDADSVTVTDGGSISVVATREEDGETTRETLVKQSLGAVEYNTGGDTLAYQGGGVWRQGDGYAQMVSPPEFDFNGDTLTIPVVNVTAAETPARLSGDSVRLSSGGSETIYPKGENRQNPVENSELTVKVQSDYYRAWGRYFERRVGGEVTIKDATETEPGKPGAASVTLSTDYDNAITYGAASTATSGFNLKGGGPDDTFLDSYDSSEGPYSPSERQEDGRIVAAGNVNIGGGVTVYGDVVVPEGNHVNVNPNSEIRNGEIQNEPIDVQRPAGRVRQQVTAASKTNDNDAVEAIDGNSLTGGDVTLSGGTYYIDDELSLNDRTLTLDPSSENITLAVTGNIDISNGGEIAVADGNSNNVARVYTTGGSLTMNDGTVSVPDEASPRFWLYGTDDLTATMSSESKFVGIYYAPGDDSSLDMRSRSEIYGSMAVGEPDLKSGSTIHYDRAASGMPVYDSDVTLFSYLHVSRNTVVVEES